MSDRFARLAGRAGLRKSVIILAVGFVAAVAILQGINLWSNYRQTIAVTQVKAEDLSYILAEHMLRSVAAVDASLKQLVLHSSRVGGPTTTPEAWDPALRSAIAGMSYVGSLSVTDANGTIRHSTFPSLVGQSRRDDFLFQQLAKDPGAGVIADKPFRSRVDQRIIIPIGRRLTGFDGSFQGAVVATLVPETFRDFYNSVDVGSQGFIWVMHSSGQMFFREPAFKTADESERPPTIPLADLQRNANGLFKGPVEQGGSNYITSWHALKEPPIIVVVSLSQNEALQRWRRDAWWSVGLTTILALVIAAASLQLIRQLDLRAVVEQSLVKRDQEFLAAQRLAGLGALRFSVPEFKARVSPQINSLLSLPTETDEITTEQLLQQLVESDRENFRKAFESCVESGTPWQMEVQVMLDQDAARVLLTEGAKQIDGSSGGDILAVFQDVTERRMVEQRSAQSERLAAVGRLTGGVAHDFNNLLTVIIGRSDLLLTTLPSDSSSRTGIEEIERAAQRAARLTRQLLAFSRKQLLQAKVIDLNSVLSDMEQMLNRLIGEDIELGLMLEPALGHIRADPGQIEQVVMNLVVNSRDAMPKGGKLIIETNNVVLDESYARNHDTVVPGNYVLLAVSDTGTGIEKEIQEHIFEPFFSTKPAGKGTGLGLSTAYGIIKQSGGNIWVYSEQDKGTTFKIYLPRIDELPIAKETPTQKTEVNQGSETILLVEDDDSLRKLASDVLQMNGYTVITAPNAKEAIEIHSRQRDRIHLLLTDVVMPGASGRELAEQLNVRDPQLKILYMSGYTDDTVVLHAAFDEGIQFIQKPFSPDALTDKVRDVLDKSES